MAIIIISIAALLCWIWIEITLFIIAKNDISLGHIRGISYKKFIWILRIVFISLFFSLSTYMYFFDKITFQKALEYCLGIIK